MIKLSFAIYLTFIPFIIALVSPQTKPCPHDAFNFSDNPALNQDLIKSLRSKILECLEVIRGSHIKLEEATCDELMCAYQCGAESFELVRL